MNVQEALSTLRQAGKGILVIDVPDIRYTKKDICDKWNRSSTWFDRLLNDTACLLQVEKKGSKGRGNHTLYKSESVIREELRLQSMGKL